MSMYAKHYGFTGLPFQLTPDSQFFFRSAGHKRALSHLVYGLEQQEGFLIVTGEVGAGKTTLVELLSAQLDRTAYVIARVMTTLVSPDDLLRLVGDGFGIEETGSKSRLLRLIEDRLRALRAAGRRPLLVVDEVQALSLAGLEELRMVSNISDNGRSMLQIILLGQPEFRQTVARPELNQLRQRVLVSYHLGPLSVEETRAYIEHRLTAVGWIGRPAWQADAFARVHHYTGGIPRRINRLCSRVLLHGALEGSMVITGAAVDDTAIELEADIGGDAAPPPPQTAAPPAELGGRLDALERKLDQLVTLLGAAGRGEA